MNKIKYTDKTTKAGAAALVFIIALLAFVPILGNGFVNWDDPIYIYENIHIRSLDLRWIFTAVVVGNYHPITMLSHTLDYALFGLRPMGHHLTSIIFHGLNSALFFILALRLIGWDNKKNLVPLLLLPALAAALLFALHPLHVESIAWASERKDLLTTFFFLLAILTYLSYTEGAKKIRFYSLTLLFFILALLSKPMAISLPLVLLLLDFYPLKRIDKNLTGVFIEKIPFYIISLGSAVLTLWAQRVDGALRSLETHTLSTRIYIAIRAVLFYLQKLIAPVNLSPYYPMPFKTELFSPAFIISLLIIILITLLCLFALKRHKRWPITLWAFYLITLLPVSGLVAVGGQAAANRYAYIPTMGFFILAGAIISKLRGKGDLSLKKSAITAYAVLLIILTLLGITTIREEALWKDTRTLMNRAIGLYPRRAVIQYTLRGLTYESEGDLQLALNDYNKAISINPDLSDAYINRGIIYGKRSLFNLAIKEFSRAASLDPSNAKAYLNRGAAYMGTGDYGSAAADLKRAVELDPLNKEAQYNLALAYQNTGEKTKAAISMKKAAELGLPEAREFIRNMGQE
ncbi:MAG: tetratricopeptide repeat protein [Thermodesulfobacteriota bacterium]